MRVVGCLRLMLLPMLLLAVGCGMFDDDSQASRYRGARMLWLVRDVSSYRFTVSKSCFCLMTPPLVVEVRNGVVVSATPVEEPAPGVPVPDLRQVPTIDSLFANIGKALGRRQSGVVAEYDASYGYPTSANIDWVKDAVDDEVSYQVLAFTPLSN